MKKYSVILSVLLIGLLSFSLIGCSSNSGSGAGGGSVSAGNTSGGGSEGAGGSGDAGNTEGAGTAKEPLRFMAATVGGEWYPIAVAISEGWKGLGIESTVLPGGGASNVLGLSQNQGDVGFTFSVTAVDGTAGNAPFEKPLDGYRALLCLNASYVQPVVYANSGINSIEDLRGKRINVYTKGYTSELNARLVLKTYGLTYDDMSAVNYLSDDDAIDQLKDGHLDCTISTGGIPDSGFIDMASVRAIKVLGMTPDKLAEATELNDGLYPTFIPAGTYGIPEDVNVLGTRLMLVVRTEIPEETVYNLVKGVHENLNSLYHVNSNLEEVTIETMAADCGIEYHPGAIKYYQEQGVI